MLRATVALVALVALCLGLSLVAAQPHAPTPAVTMDEIKKAWQERQDKVKTMKMSWKYAAVQAKGSMDSNKHFMAAFAADLQIPKTPQPPGDLRLSGETTVVLSGERFLHERLVETWQLSTQSITPLRTRASFDGKDYRHVESDPRTPDPETVVIETAGRSTLQLESVELKPVWWSVRGAKNALGQCSLDSFELTGRVIQLRGTTCLEVDRCYAVGDRRSQPRLDSCECQTRFPTRLATNAGVLLYLRPQLRNT